MRLVLPLVLALAAACASSQGAISPAATCQSDYDVCVRREADAQACESYRDQCVVRAAAAQEAATAKERGYEEFLREREEAE